MEESGTTAGQRETVVVGAGRNGLAMGHHPDQFGGVSVRTRKWADGRMPRGAAEPRISDPREMFELFALVLAAL